jgi:hypothetical protein
MPEATKEVEQSMSTPDREERMTTQETLRALLNEMESWRDIEAREDPDADAVSVLRVVVSAIKTKLAQAPSPVSAIAGVKDDTR